MKKVYSFLCSYLLLIGFFLITLSDTFGQSCVIDQPQNNSFANVFTTTAVGQTFTACESGVITKIRVNFMTIEVESLKLQLSTGTNTLTPEYTQDFEVKSIGNSFIYLTTPFPVDEQQTYSFSVIGTTGNDLNANILAFNGNPYTEGHEFTESNGAVTVFGADLDFTITIVEKACVIDQHENNSFANIFTTTAVGQTFIACGEGIITDIRINLMTLDVETLRLQLSTGVNTLNPEYTQDFKPSGIGNTIIQLTTPFPVDDQQTYSFSIVGTTGTDLNANILAFNGNPYLDGHEFTETNGAVTIFGADLDFTVSIIERACVLDQHENNSFANVFTTNAVGQTFTACNSGVISEIRINLMTLDVETLRLQLSSGVNTLNPEYTQDFKPIGIGNTIIQLTTPFPVDDQQTYSFSITGTTGTDLNANILAFNGNPYPNGHEFVESNGSVTIFGADLDFTITIIESNAPQNDLTCNAIDLPVDGVVQSGFTNEDATASNGEENIAPAPGSCATSWCSGELFEATEQVQNSVWFNFTAPPSGAVEVSTCDLADFDTQLAAYSASDCNDFSTYQLVGANDDGPGTCATDFDSFLELSGLTPGETYYIMVDGFAGSNGEFGISITEVMVSSIEETEVAAVGLEVFPNPNNGRFQVAVNGLQSNAQLMISNVAGQTLYQREVKMPENLVDIQLQNLSTGMYFLTLINEHQKIVQKVIVGE